MLRLKPEDVKVVEWARQIVDLMYTYTLAAEKPLDHYEERKKHLDEITRRLRGDLDLMLFMLGRAKETSEVDAEFVMDADTRHTLVHWRGVLEIEGTDRELVLPWYLLKEIAAQILNFEVWQEKVRAQAEGKELTVGQQHKELAAQFMLKEAETEKRALIEQHSLRPKGPVSGFDQ